jgi:hypothetical protein
MLMKTALLALALLPSVTQRVEIEIQGLPAVQRLSCEIIPVNGVTVEYNLHTRVYTLALNCEGIFANGFESPTNTVEAL